MRRLAACWNACQGVPIEVLEAQQAGGLPWSVADQLDKLADLAIAERQRDELLEALHGIVSAWGPGFEEGESPSLDRARATIAKVKGGQG